MVWTPGHDPGPGLDHVGFLTNAGKIYETRCKETADKILDGQILDGGARGMWGPVCINTDLLATYVLPGLSDEVELAAGSGRLHGTETGVLCHSSPSLSHCWRK